MAHTVTRGCTVKPARSSLGRQQHGLPVMNMCDLRLRRRRHDRTATQGVIDAPKADQFTFSVVIPGVFRVRKALPFIPAIRHKHTTQTAFEGWFFIERLKPGIK